MLLHPADHPEVRRETLDLLIQIAAEQPGHAVMPTFGGTGGHPVLIAAELAVDIVAYEGPGGLRQFWIDHADRCVRREVDDPGVVFDLDTPSDYKGVQYSMAISVFDLFTIGIGPSSSHSIGPMRAARRFVEKLRADGLLAKCARVEVRLYGSLALTGKGHGTDKAILLGLEGATPEAIDPDDVEPRVAAIRANKKLTLAGGPIIAFDEERDLLWLRKESLPQHPNGMRFTAFDAAGAFALRIHVLLDRRRVCRR